MKRFLVTPLHNWTIAYVVAFSVVGFILMASLILNQVALYREGISRQAAALEARQSIRSQSIGRASLLLLINKGDHRAVVQELQRDVDGLEQDRLFLNAHLLSYYPDFAHLDGGRGRAIAVYFLIRTTTLDLIAIEQRHLPEQARRQAEVPDITTIFNKQPEQLSNIQAAQAIIDADTDSYIARIRAIDIASSILGALVLLFEGVFVVYPATRRLQHS